MALSTELAFWRRASTRSSSRKPESGRRARIVATFSAVAGSSFGVVANISEIRLACSTFSALFEAICELYTVSLGYVPVLRRSERWLLWFFFVTLGCK